PFAALAKLPVQAAVETGPRVDVFDEVRKPVRGADVFVIDLDRVDVPTHSYLQTCYGEDRPLLLATRYARRYRTADDGSVHVELPEHAQVVAARGTDTGMTMPLGTRIPVRLQPRRPVYAEVVDLDGRPIADVFVAVVQNGSSGHMVNQARTGSDGRVHILTRPGEDLLLTACALTSSPVRAVLPADYFAKPPQLIRLQLPATGSVLVRLVDTDGKPWANPQSADLSVFGPYAEQSVRLAIGEPTARGWLFSHVGLDLGLVAGAFVAEYRETLRGRGDGPARAGETATIDVVFGDDEVLLRGRLLGVDGTPLRDVQLPGFQLRNSGYGGEVLRTDGDGVFAGLFNLTSSNDEPVRFEFSTTTRKSPSPVAVAAIDVGPRQRGTIEVGDLRLVDAPIRIAGQALRDDGEPAVGATVVFSGNTPARRPWWTVSTDKQGRFALRDLQELGAGTVALRNSKLSADDLEVRGDEQDLVLRATRTGSLRVDFAAGLAPNRIRLELTPQGGSSRNYQLEAPFLVTQLRPGSYDVVASFEGLELLRLQGVQVPPATVSNDPRLEVDWRKLVPSFEVEVHGVAGTPNKTWGELWPPGAKQPTRFFGDGHGHLILPRIEGARYAVAAEDHRTASIVAGDSPTEVTMKPRARLRFVLPEGFSLPPGVYVRPPGGPLAILDPGRDYRPNEADTANLQFVMQGPRGTFIELWQQDVPLPNDDRVHEVRLDVDETIVKLARQIEEQTRQASGR
ncbi:MAG: hypothetical protein KDC48_14155, partial [Planctomycetes bacterium]|nr:hypothetical protein [Planctomycetota bacterium]